MTLLPETTIQNHIKKYPDLEAHEREHERKTHDLKWTDEIGDYMEQELKSSAYEGISLTEKNLQNLINTKFNHKFSLDTINHHLHDRDLTWRRPSRHQLVDIRSRKPEIREWLQKFVNDAIPKYFHRIDNSDEFPYTKEGTVVILQDETTIQLRNDRNIRFWSKPDWEIGTQTKPDSLVICTGFALYCEDENGNPSTNPADFKGQWITMRTFLTRKMREEKNSKRKKTTEQVLENEDIHNIHNGVVYENWCKELAGDMRERFQKKKYPVAVVWCDNAPCHKKCTEQEDEEGVPHYPYSKLKKDQLKTFLRLRGNYDEKFLEEKNKPELYHMAKDVAQTQSLKFTRPSNVYHILKEQNIILQHTVPWYPELEPIEMMFNFLKKEVDKEADPKTRGMKELEETVYKVAAYFNLGEKCGHMFKRPLKNMLKERNRVMVELADLPPPAIPIKY